MQNAEPILDQLQRLLDLATGRAEGPAPCLHRIPVDLYASQEHFEREWETIFSRRPLVLCHSSQLPKAGSSLVHDEFGLPLITARDDTGVVRTFMNVCRHRNMRLVNATGFHELKSLVCPYHQWTYGIDGQLRNIPREADFCDINKADLGLVELPTEERDGLVWFKLAPRGRIDLDEYLSDIGPDLVAFGLADAVVYTEHTRELQCNWKLIHDAFLDGYHVIRLHKNTVGDFFPDCVSSSEQCGMHIRSAVARNEIFDADKQQRNEWDPRLLSTFAYTLFPNAIVIMHPDYTSLLRMVPMSADRTLFSHSMLLSEMPNSDKARAHFDKSFDLIDQGVFQAEDIFVCEGAQKGIRSGANQDLLLGANEIAVKQFHDLVEREVNG
ncbi:MAG: aromatic ring-hydroxylating dioxygenase subunit alpha [Pseudomonadales bacterium]